MNLLQELSSAAKTYQRIQAEIGEDQKKCRLCEKIKPTSEFYAHPEGIKKVQSYCKVCDKERRKIRYWKNKAKGLPHAKR